MNERERIVLEDYMEECKIRMKMLSMEEYVDIIENGCGWSELFYWGKVLLDERESS